jgi:hypothetical protein
VNGLKQTGVYSFDLSRSMAYPLAVEKFCSPALDKNTSSRRASDWSCVAQATERSAPAATPTPSGVLLQWRLESWLLVDSHGESWLLIAPGWWWQWGPSVRVRRSRRPPAACQPSPPAAGHETGRQTEGRRHDACVVGWDGLLYLVGRAEMALPGRFS